VHTTSLAGAYSRINCKCDPGYQCLYYKQIQAVVTLNVTLAEFNANTNNVKNNFLSAMAAAAKVSVSHVTINGVVSRSRRRNLLSVTTKEGLEAHKNAKATEHGIEVHATVMGAVRLHDLEKQLAAHHNNDSTLHMGHVWAESHKIDANAAPWNALSTGSK
jgi:hypothetical protein